LPYRAAFRTEDALFMCIPEGRPQDLKRNRYFRLLFRVSSLQFHLSVSRIGRNDCLSLLYPPGTRSLLSAS